MSVASVLKFNINTFLNSQGFQQFKSNLKQSMSLSQKFKSVTSSTLGQLAIGYFTISGLVGQYNKAVEASNEALANETKLYAVLRAQNFTDKQIEGLKEYASELQNVGVIGDDTSYAGIKQLATFKLQEESIRKLLPRVQDWMVAEKGLNSTSADAEKWAKTLGIAVSSGQVRALKQVGVVLDEHTSKLFENANEQERVAILSKELKTRIGEQNAEFLKTPEGKITSAKNRIGDLYEVWGMSVREIRAKFWEFVADNAEGLKDVVNRVFKAGASFVDTFIGVFRDIKKGFNALPDGAKTAFKVIGGLALATKFPLVTLGFAIEDVFAAFQGKESFTEDAINALLKFTGTDYRFADLRKGVSDFWKLWTEGADSGIEKITFTTKVLTNMLDIIKGGAGLLQMIWGVSGGIVTDTFRAIRGSFTGDFENVGEGTIGNIKAGWNRMNNAYDNIQETYYMYEKNELEKYSKEQKQLLERLDYIGKNQNTFGVPVEKDFVIPYQPVNSANIPDFNKLLEPKTFDNKVMNGAKKTVTANQTVNYNPTYKTYVTINESKDGKNGFEDIVKILREKDKENLERIKAQVGMGLTY